MCSWVNGKQKNGSGVSVPTAGSQRLLCAPKKVDAFGFEGGTRVDSAKFVALDGREAFVEGANK